MVLVDGCHNFKVFFLDRQPFNLSAFTLDDYQNALRHCIVDLPCSLITELHVSLLNVLKEKPPNTPAAVGSLMRLREHPQTQAGSEAWDGEGDREVTIDQLLKALSDVGNGWERRALKEKDGRKGWEEALVGCIKDVSPPLGLLMLFLIIKIISRRSTQQSKVYPAYARYSHAYSSAL